MPLGKTFAPGSDLQMQGSGQNGSGGPRGLSPQQAVKILSLRVPEALPSNAPVNRSLLTSPGGRAAGASGLGSMIQQLIQSFLPGGGAPGVPTLPQGGPSMGGAPAMSGPTMGGMVPQPSGPQAPMSGGQAPPLFDGDFSGMDPQYWMSTLFPNQNPWYGVNPTPASPTQRTAPPPPIIRVDNPPPTDGGLA